MDVLQIANSPLMWIACGLAVSIVMIQAIVFARNAYKAGPKVGLTEAQMKQGMKSAAITSIGPSIVVVSGMLSLLVALGGPIAWMRLAMIGSVMFEAVAAGIGTNVVGVELGVDPLTPEALGMALWTMVLCSIGWVAFSTFSASRMDKVQAKVAGGDTKKLITISTAAIIGVFAAMSSQHLIKFYNFKEGVATLDKNAIACVLGMVLMTIMMKVSKDKPKLQEWNLTIAILLAVVIVALI